MAMPVIVKILLTDGSCQRLSLSHGVPESLEDLLAEVKKQCNLQGNIRLQFMDSLFGNEFMNLTSVSEVEDRGTLRVIDLSTPTMQYESFTVLPLQASSPCSTNDSDSSLDNKTINEAIEDTTVGIYVVKEHSSSDEVEDIGIVLEGIKVLQDLDNVALAVAMLFGLMYVLNLSYPADLRYTLEVIQKIWMELDGGKLSNKALALKNRLSQ